jgi:hypothetical protein
LAVVAACIVIGTAGRVNAANLLAVTDQEDPVLVLLAEAFTLTLTMAFDDTMIGGGVDITFDHDILRLDSITFDPQLPDEATFRCPTTGAPGSIPCPSDPDFVAWGNFASGITGIHGVTVLGFTAIGLGMTDVIPIVSSQFSDLSGNSLAVEPSGVTVVTPEPSSIALLLLGLVGLRAFALSRAGRTLIGL